MERVLCQLVYDEPIQLSVAYEFCRSPRCGAIHTFSGTIRDTDLTRPFENKNKSPIRGIHFEAYDGMLMKQLNQIGAQILNQNDGDESARLAIVMRLGFVPVAESSLIICASSTGRNFSHQSIMRALEQIKSQAVVWKRLVLADGREQWDLEQKSEAQWLS